MTIRLLNVWLKNSRSWTFYRTLRAVLETYSVPAAGAVVGWIFGGKLASLLETVSAGSAFHQAFMASAPLLYGAQLISAILAFLFANRYLN